MRSAALSCLPAVPVPRYDYPAQFDDVDGLLSAIREMLLGGRYVLSDEVRSFEAAFAAFCGCEYARGVNSGTDALAIALRALGIGPGDEVVTQANTFHATVAAIELAGAKPVLVDVDPGTFLMSEATLLPALSGRVRAIIPVHLFGKPCPMPELLAAAARHGALVLEDAAQAHGASLDGQRAGSFGIAGCFSFHPSKNLAAGGDGGAIVTRDGDLAAKVDLYRSLGQRAPNEHLVAGFNSKLDSIQALILSSKLGRLDQWNASRARTAAIYRAELGGLPLSFQAQSPGELHVYHLFQVQTAFRDALLSYLRARQIDAVVRYPTPVHLQESFSRWGWRSGDFPVSERLSRELLCLPIRPAMPEAEISAVIESVHAFFRDHGSGLK